MKAVLCKTYGAPETLVVGQVPSPLPQENQVVVSVHAASVNFPDILIIENKYQFKPPLPFSPGCELSGIVDKVGKGVKRFKIGDRVMSFTSHGAFAEEVAIDEAKLVKIPSDMDFHTAASLLLAYGTAEHALTDRANIQRGETLLVLGAAGGVGLAAVEIGKAMGAHVIACASTSEKLGECAARGADTLINYVEEDLRSTLKAKFADRGIDVIFDAVGGDLTEAAFRSIAWGGRHLIVGFAGGRIPAVQMNLPLLKGAAFLGVFWGDLAKKDPGAFSSNIARVLALHAAGKIRPHISKIFSLEETAAALGWMATRKVIGKIVISVRPSQALPI